MVEVTSNQPPGTPTWIDLGIPDIQRAKEFYGTLFGWEFEEGPPEAGGYTMCLLRGQPVAAVMANPDPNATSFWWNLYFATDDADGTAKHIADAGGQVVVAPIDAMDAGRMAIALDPTGAQFGLWQGRMHPGARIVNEPGSLAWNELRTPTADAARPFYQAVFDYTLEPMAAPDIDYTVLHRGDGQMIGGIHGVADAPSSSWITYFEVEDTDAAVRRVLDGGGACPGEPQDSPYGRVAIVEDPFGVAFHVIASAQNPPG
ncbi:MULTISPECIES: VOC family protein [unclassified Frankia]|uniref:VOC family protein n=1 Tax=unclassified Frankia TaxID=2632575 RepID=UPI002AD415BD|nr:MULTISPECIES: VOC family protein [unclassified Frankia]